MSELDIGALRLTIDEKIDILAGESEDWVTDTAEAQQAKDLYGLHAQLRDSDRRENRITAHAFWQALKQTNIERPKVV